MDTSKEPVHLAIDIGASSGRVLAGSVSPTGYQLEEIHRFENGPVHHGKRLVWNLLAVWEEILQGLHLAAARFGNRICSVGADTWGVDFILLDRNDDQVGPAFCYRDQRTQGMLEKAFERMSRQEIFSHTGLQFMEINTAYQLLAMRLEESPLLDIAESFLMVPDYFHWLLSGEKCNEFTNASTSQLLDPQTCDWSRPVIDALEIPASIFSKPIQPGTKLGKITSYVANRTGLSPDVDVIVPATHDTGSAVLAVPAATFAQAQPDWCYISCGTWSLMGVELDAPNLTQACQLFNFTNEGGVGGSVRLLKNISGLWIVQQCREQWRREGRDLGWSELSRLASEASSMVAVIDPDDPAFLAPENMPEAIKNYCRRTSQRVPSSEGEIIRCALESLALKYRMVLETLEQLVGQKLSTIHMVGGGVQNKLLCQFAADACNRNVVAGPIEATALGNILIQAVGCGRLSGVDQARELVRKSPNIEHYQPHTDTATIACWSHGYEKLRQLSLGSR
jgi:rhamnulokinase